MKKLLSVLLVACMAVGVGGAVSAGAVDFSDLPPVEEAAEALTVLMPLAAYVDLNAFEGTNPELIAGLRLGKTIDTAFTTAYSEAAACYGRYQLKGESDLDVLLKAYADGSLIIDVEQSIASLATLFGEYFNPIFLSKFETYKAAYVEGWGQFWLLIYHLAKDQETIANWDELKADMAALNDWMNENLVTYEGAEDNVRNSGDFVAVTAFFLELQTRAKAIEDKIEYTTTTPEPWWNNLPTFVQWLLRYILFGWIWMRLF